MEVVGDQQNSIANRDATERNEADQTGDGQICWVMTSAITPPIKAVGSALRICRTIRTEGNKSSSTTNMPTTETPARTIMSLRRPLLAFKLAAVFDEVADRHLHLLADTLFDFADRSGQIAAFGVAADHDPAPGVFAIDRVRPGALADVCDLTKFDLSAFDFPVVMRQVDAKSTKIGVVGAVLFFQTHEQIESPLTFEYLRDDFALQCRLQNVGNVFAGQTVERQVIRSQLDVQLCRLANRFDDRRCDARHVLNRRFDLLGNSLQRVQIVAMNLDRDLAYTPETMWLIK